MSRAVSKKKMSNLNPPVSHVVSEKLVKEEPDQYGQQHPVEKNDVLEVLLLALCLQFAIVNY